MYEGEPQSLFVVAFAEFIIGKFTTEHFFSNWSNRFIRKAAGMAFIIFEKCSNTEPASNERHGYQLILSHPYDATVKGFELDFQTSLWYLPFPLKGVVFGINYTHIKSEATYCHQEI